MKDSIGDAVHSVDASNKDLISLYCIDDCFNVAREFTLETLIRIRSGKDKLDDIINQLEEKLKKA